MSPRQPEIPPSPPRAGVSPRSSSIPEASIIFSTRSPKSGLPEQQSQTRQASTNSPAASGPREQSTAPVSHFPVTGPGNNGKQIESGTGLHPARSLGRHVPFAAMSCGQAMPTAPGIVLRRAALTRAGRASQRVQKWP